MKFKPGDRVKVEFEGLLVRKFHTATARAWEVKVGNRISTVLVSEVECTLIEPEIVLPEIPGTIVQVDPLNEQGERAAFELQVDLWFESGGDAFSTLELTEQCRAYGYRVIPAAEAEGVSE